MNPKSDKELKVEFGKRLLEMILNNAEDEMNLHGEEFPQGFIEKYQGHKNAIQKLVNKVGSHNTADAEYLAWHSFNLGYITLTSKLSPSEIRLANILEGNQKFQKSFSGLEIKNWTASLWKQVAQQIASSNWANDKSEIIRTGEMAERVLSELESIRPDQERMIPALREFPTQKTVQGWISAIAPDYAKKGGRPRKK